MVVTSTQTRTRRAWLAGALIVCLGLVRPDAHPFAQTQASEYELKAAFLYNFAKFVDWPPEADATGPVCFGVLGTDPFGATLDRLITGKMVHERPIVVRHFPTPDTVQTCHLVYVSATAARGFPADAYARTGVLSVGEDDAFLAAGGVIAFGMERNKLRFTVNPAAAERAQLKLSSQLLKLALRVLREGQ